MKVTLLDVIDFDNIWTLNSMWKKQISWAMGEITRGLGSEFMRNSKLKKKLKKTKTIEYDGS